MNEPVSTSDALSQLLNHFIGLFDLVATFVGYAALILLILLIIYVIVEDAFDRAVAHFVQRDEQYAYTRNAIEDLIEAEVENDDG